MVRKDSDRSVARNVSMTSRATVATYAPGWASTAASANRMASALLPGLIPGRASSRHQTCGDHR